MLAYLIGYLGNVLPIPGGVGVLDGGLLGALILYGAHPAVAAAGVLVYHAVALWLPTLLGTAAFLRIRRTIDQPLAPAQPTPARSPRLISSRVRSSAAIRSSTGLGAGSRLGALTVLPLRLSRRMRLRRFS
jgi:hypothetical protein